MCHGPLICDVAHACRPSFTCVSLYHLRRKTLKTRATLPMSHGSLLIPHRTHSYVTLSLTWRGRPLKRGRRFRRAFQLSRPSFRSWISSTFINIYVYVYIIIRVWVCLCAEPSNCCARRFVRGSRAPIYTCTYHYICIKMYMYMYIYEYVYVQNIPTVVSFVNLEHLYVLIFIMT